MYNISCKISCVFGGVMLAVVTGCVHIIHVQAVWVARTAAIVSAVQLQLQC